MQLLTPFSLGTEMSCPYWEVKVMGVDESPIFLGVRCLVLIGRLR